MNWLALFVTGSFCVLAAYAYGIIQPYPTQHYARAKPVVLYRMSQAALIADIWNITPSDLDKPIAIFGNARRNGRQ